MSLKILIPPTIFAAIVGTGIYQLTPVGDFVNAAIKGKFGETTTEVTPCSVSGVPTNEDGSCDYSPAEKPPSGNILPTFKPETLDNN